MIEAMEDEVCRGCAYEMYEPHVYPCKYCKNNGGDANHFRPNKESVNHPDHYQGANECIDVIRAMLTPEEFKGFLKGNSIKYRFRSGMKNGDEDIKKAEWYETKLIEEMREQDDDKNRKCRSDRISSGNQRNEESNE